MNCQNIHQVHSYHDGELPLDEQRALEMHLRDCTECSELLADLRALSEMVSTASRAEMPWDAVARLQNSWRAARDHSALRIAEWLTAAAAALLVAALPFWPGEISDAGALSGTWQAVAVMPPPESYDDSRPDLVAVAEWMVDDLTPAAERRQQ